MRLVLAVLLVVLADLALPSWGGAFTFNVASQIHAAQRLPVRAVEMKLPPLPDPFSVAIAAPHVEPPERIAPQPRPRRVSIPILILHVVEAPASPADPA